MDLYSNAVRASSTSRVSAAIKNNSSASNEWLSIRRLKSNSDKKAARARARKVIQERKNVNQVYKVGSVVSSLSVGKLMPIKEGKKKRQRERVFGIILNKPKERRYSWYVKFTNDVEGYYSQSVLKFEHNNNVPKKKNDSINTDHEIVDANKKQLLDYLATCIIKKTDFLSTTASKGEKTCIYTDTLELFQPLHSWLNRNLLRVHVSRTRKKLDMANKQDQSQ